MKTSQSMMLNAVYLMTVANFTATIGDRGMAFFCYFLAAAAITIGTIFCWLEWRDGE